MGAYPPGGIYDEYRGTAKERALAFIANVAAPTKDPVLRATVRCGSSGRKREHALRRAAASKSKCSE